MKGKIIIINILYYFFNNNIIFGRLCDKKKCCNYYNNKGINDEFSKENNIQKNKNNEENKDNEEDKKRKDDILKKKREELLKKYNKVNDLNKTLPDGKQIQIFYDEKNIELSETEDSLKKISDTLDKEEKDILAILGKVNVKKYEEQLKKTLEDRKKECNNLFEEVNNLIKDNFTKYFKKNDIKINDDTESKIDKINKKGNIYDLDEITKAIDDLDEIKKELNNKKDEINKLINEDEEKDKYFCKTKEEFIQKFNERKNELISSNYFKNKDLIDKLTADLYEANIGDYFTMYSEMTKDVFNHDIALDLQIYRYILNLEGFTTALDNVLSKEIKLYITNNCYYTKEQCSEHFYGLKYDNEYYFFKDDKVCLKDLFKKEKEDFDKDNWDQFGGLGPKTRQCINILNSKLKFCKNVDKDGKIMPNTKLSELNKNFELFDNTTGKITIDNENFKYLRCNEKCTNDNNCVSCKLRKLLKDEDILALFISIYKNQANSNTDKEAMLMQRIIYDGLKKDKKYNFYSLNFDGRREKFCKEITNEFRKCVMIEWALTIEFMTRFIKKYYNNHDDFILYRTLININSIDKIKHNIYESTSIIGNLFEGLNNADLKKQPFFVKTQGTIKPYKLFFNYVISPNEKTILFDDKELEIGYISIDEKYVVNNIPDYKEYLNKLRHENFDKNFGKGKWEEIDVPNSKKKK